MRALDLLAFSRFDDVFLTLDIGAPYSVWIQIDLARQSKSLESFIFFLRHIGDDNLFGQVSIPTNASDSSHVSVPVKLTSNLASYTLFAAAAVCTRRAL